MCVIKGPPSLWLTINPADTQDPIAQVLCDQEINLDRFDTFDLKPSDTAIANDPYAAASFFHMIINTVLECLIGIKPSSQNKSLE